MADVEPTPGAPVSLKGETGTYRVTRLFPDYVELYGGDKDPNGRRQFRAVRPERLRPRKLTDQERAAAER
jgi:hypothetical protein